MIVGWKQLLIKIIIWLILEILLNWLGVDTFVDYGEFILQNQMLSFSNYSFLSIEIIYY